jgi:hypothetical protein
MKAFFFVLLGFIFSASSAFAQVLDSRTEHYSLNGKEARAFLVGYDGCIRTDVMAGFDQYNRGSDGRDMLAWMEVLEYDECESRVIAQTYAGRYITPSEFSFGSKLSSAQIRGIFLGVSYDENFNESFVTVDVNIDIAAIEPAERTRWSFISENDCSLIRYRYDGSLRLAESSGSLLVDGREMIVSGMSDSSTIGNVRTGSLYRITDATCSLGSQN